MIAKDVFYDNLRGTLGSIKLEKTVETIDAIIDYCEIYKCTVQQTAYILATANWEARHKKYKNDFYPITERGSWTYIIKNYWYNTVVRGWLGNIEMSDAWTYRGRGLVQLTGRANYKKFGLENSPEKALDTDLAVLILVNGMMDGSFTGAKLSKYINKEKTDYINARRAVNGTDKASEIKELASKYELFLLNSKNRGLKIV